MSYARIGPESDVYVFASEHGLHCHWCVLGLGDATALGSFSMVRHLKRHITAGDMVPKSTIREIRADAFGNWIVRVVAKAKRLMEPRT